jgi:hypothetical protein
VLLNINFFFLINFYSILFKIKNFKIINLLLFLIAKKY